MIANGSKIKLKKIKNNMKPKYIPEYLEEIVKLLKEFKKEIKNANDALAILNEQTSAVEEAKKKAGRPKKGEIEVRDADDK